MQFFPTKSLRPGLTPWLGDTLSRSEDVARSQDFFQILSTQTQKTEPAPYEPKHTAQQETQAPSPTPAHAHPAETSAPEQSATQRPEHPASTQADTANKAPEPHTEHTEHAAHAAKSAESATPEAELPHATPEDKKFAVSGPSTASATSGTPDQSKSAILAAALEHLAGLLHTPKPDPAMPEKKGKPENASPRTAVAQALQDLAQALKSGIKPEQVLQHAEKTVRQLREAGPETRELGTALEAMLRKVRDSLELSGRGHQFATSGKAQGADTFMREIDSLLAKIAPLAQPAKQGQTQQTAQAQKPLHPASSLEHAADPAHPDARPIASGKTQGSKAEASIAANAKAQNSKAETAAPDSAKVKGSKADTSISDRTGLPSAESGTSSAKPKTEADMSDTHRGSAEKKDAFPMGAEGRPHTASAEKDLSRKSTGAETGQDVPKATHFAKSSAQDGAGVPVQTPSQQGQPAASMRQGNVSPRSAEVFRQVENGAFSNVGQGTKQLVLRLNPEELGQVSVVLQVRGKEVQAVLRTSTQEASQALSEQLGQLRSHLEAQGLKVSKLEVQTGLPDAQSQWQGAEQHNRYQENRELAMSAKRWRTLGQMDTDGDLAREMHTPLHREKTSHNGLDLFA